MSLDVYLISKNVNVVKKPSGIFVRQNGQTIEISREEWKEKYPDTNPVMIEPQEAISNEVFHWNITHNMAKCAEEAKIYQYLWRPDELNIKQAKKLINPLREGLHKLKSEPEKYKKFNPENGWGNYEGLVTFVEKYLDACYKYPDAEIGISR